MKEHTPTAKLIHDRAKHILIDDQPLDHLLLWRWPLIFIWKHQVIPLRKKEDVFYAAVTRIGATDNEELVPFIPPGVVREIVLTKTDFDLLQSSLNAHFVGGRK
ncbi:MAG: hypothetical protein KDC35_03915 [Acidobacteria bacterium]|nr:hypothetical protein [Acidobacteriota bacterium]